METVDCKQLSRIISASLFILPEVTWNIVIFHSFKKQFDRLKIATYNGALYGTEHGRCRVAALETTS
jgi:hypothetical protein